MELGHLGIACVVPPSPQQHVRQGVGGQGGELKEVDGGEQAATGKTRLIGLATAFVTLLAMLFLAGAIADVPSAFSTVHGEEWLWLVPAVLLAVASFAGSAIALSGAADVRLPVIRTYLLELGRSFTTMATPGGVGSFALTTRFLERLGMGLAPATASTALTSVGSLIIDLLALAIGGVLSASAFQSENLHTGAGTKGWFLVVGVVALAAVIAAIWHFPRLHRRVVPQVHQAVELVRSVARRPRKAALLFAGQAVLLFCQVGCLYSVLRLVHQHASPAVLLVLVVLATMAQRAVPIPGALGAPEAILVTGLTGAGLPSSAVVAVALTYRLLTYWLPPIPGFIAIRWLHHRTAL